MRRRDDQETTQDRRRDERLPVHVLWVWVFPRESVFGPESIGKHITQLVANCVFPRESVFGPESIGKHITQLVANWVFPRESVFGPESIGKRITQLVANWVFPRESVFGPESIGKHITQLIANWAFPSETEYIAGGLLRKSTYPGTAPPTQLQMYATDLRGEPRSY